MQKINLIKPERYVSVTLIKKEKIHEKIQEKIQEKIHEKIQVENVVNNGIDKILIMLKNEFTNVNKKYDMILEKIEKNDNDVGNMHEKMEMLLKNINDMNKVPVRIHGDDIKNIVKEKLDIDKCIVIKHLKKHSILSDAMLIKQIYMQDGMESINYISERKLEYWKSGRWVLDRDGTYMREILTDNLKRLYTGVNYMSNFNDLNIFMLNQKHIINMGTDKYKKKLIKELKHLIM